MAVADGAVAEGEPNWSALPFTARDGIKIHARCYPARSRLTPVVCVPALTRNSRDFHVLASALACGPRARTVYAIDLRGRGLSENDPDWRNYVVPIEALDVLDLFTVAGIAGAHVIGTSRGGLIAMAMAAIRPGVLTSVILNDIGPVIEQEGLLRISSYVGRQPLPKSWSEAAAMIKGNNARFFPSLRDEDWETLARQWYNEADGQPAPGYDAKLARTFSVKDGRIPPLWTTFDALGRIPVLTVRGECSDILSEATVKEMCARHRQCALVTVPDQGHAPLLMDSYSIAAVAQFLDAAENGEPISGRSFG